MKITRPNTPTSPPAATSRQTGVVSASRNLPLHAGDLVRGRVMETRPGGIVILDLDGNRLTAKTATPLPANEELWFEVTHASRPPWLHLIPPSRGLAQEMLRLLASETALQPRSLASIQTLAEDEALAAPAGRLISLLRGDNAGLPAESGAEPDDFLTGMLSWLRKPAPAIITDKSAAILDDFLAALRDLPADHPLANSQELATAGRTAKILSLMQGLNQQTPEGQPPFLVFPCFLSGQTGWGQWFLSLPDSQPEAGEDPACAIDMFLTMSRLGDVQISLSLAATHGHGVVQLPTKEAAGHVGSQLDGLADRLAMLGISLNLSCRQAAVPSLVAMKELIERHTGVTTFSLIDTTA